MKGGARAYTLELNACGGYKKSTAKKFIAGNDLCACKSFHVRVSVFGDTFGDECERSVRRLFGGRVVRYHMAFLGYIRGRCLIIVSLRVCSGPQQTRNVAWIIALAGISSSGI